jgi:hypothetical protein
MRITVKAVALIAALTLAPSLLAQPRGSDPGFDFWSPVRKVVKIVKQLIHIVAQDEPMQPPPKP